MLTLTFLFIVAAIILAIVYGSGKLGPLSIAIAVILLAIVEAIHYLPK